jgi:hypothetical protein
VRGQQQQQQQRALGQTAIFVRGHHFFKADQDSDPAMAAAPPPSLLLHGCLVGPTAAMSCVHVNSGVAATFSRTKVYGGAEHGICLADNCRAHLVRQCLVEANSFCGIVLSDNCHLTMSDSASDGHSEGAGLHLVGSSTAQVTGSSFDSNYTGVTLDGRAAAASLPPPPPPRRRCMTAR